MVSPRICVLAFAAALAFPTLAHAGGDAAGVLPAQAGGVAVAGDWAGYGADTPAVFRDGTWTLKDGTSFTFGAAGDTPVVGDWDGDGIDTPGVFRAGTWTLQDGTSFSFGGPGDTPVVGDWDGDGI